MAEQRLIDANALDFNYDRRCFSEIEEGFIRGIDEAMEIIKNAPTVEAKPVVHAHWEYLGVSAGKRIYRCTNCKAEICGTANFCKECGAQMDEEEG